MTETQATIIGYQGRERKVSFAMHYSSIDTERSRFRYSPNLLSPSLASLDPPGLESLRTRWKCGMNLSHIVVLGLGQGPNYGYLYPDPNRWCDVTVEHARSLHVFDADLTTKKGAMYPDAFIASWFTCPSVHASPEGSHAHSQPPETSSSSQAPDTWTSDYAMNPNCREDSPKDVVFLFESKPSWNQRGGPELFTFGNHNPRGGLVFLNGGIVKFIRTEEELKQLRWR